MKYIILIGLIAVAATTFVIVNIALEEELPQIPSIFPQAKGK